MEAMHALFPVPMRALSRVLYGRDDYWKMSTPSHIMKLSNEELSMIFAEVVHLGHTFSAPDPLAATTLSHVCRRWHAITVSTSSLWAHISNVPHPAVNQYLSRSRKRLLNIRLEFNPLHTMSVSAALSVIKHAHRCKELHWIDESPGCVLNVSAFARMARFPVLEVLELASRTVICPSESEPLNEPSSLHSAETELYPVLRDLTLCQIHPKVLCPVLKPRLRKLTLKDLPTAGRFCVSHLFSLLRECPHLDTLELTRATPIIDVQPVIGRSHHTSQLLPVPYAWRPTLPIKNLVLNGVPTTDLWRIFRLLDMPALETLSHLVPSHIQEPRWPHTFGDQYTDQVPEIPIEVPQLQCLTLEYDILDPFRPFPQLAHVLFPNLAELRITYTHRASRWDHDSAHLDSSERAPFPPSLFQPLFRQPAFTTLRTLHLAHARIDVPLMCEFLQHALPALDCLSLEDCVGAGPLVCALGSPASFDVCLHGHGHPLPPSSYEVEEEYEDEDEEGRTIVITQTRTRTRATAEWLGLRVRTLVLVGCADVRIDCLRKLIATRAAAAMGVHDVTPGRSWSKFRLKEDKAVRGWTPCRIETVCVERCVMVTEGGVNMLRSLAGAPEFRARDGREQYA
ncbi:hypothetical protein GSI_07891 [Ganoderma sinense ZZ0214-1]|uniref:F-box domain-containing protein n=1 Tax=Ganoderma sinense ZZ0214-1 TaxID=1077348 RepID=A0A2G8S874_9APHY|nr:hypothetical protein GSI_07891 [Ganoderma sinense ZZ0214-1]